MSEDRFEQEEPKDETEDVEAHGKTAVTDEPADAPSAFYPGRSAPGAYPVVKWDQRSSPWGGVLRGKVGL